MVNGGEGVCWSREVSTYGGYTVVYYNDLLKYAFVTSLTEFTFIFEKYLLSILVVEKID